MPILHTERLTLDPFHEGDLDELLALFTDPDVRRYLLDDEIVSADWVSDEISGSAARFGQAGCGLWAVREAGSERIVGFVGYRPFFEPPELQLLYGFLPSHWGKGLGTEAAREAMRFGFEELGFDDVRAATDAPNSASMRLLERLGLEEWDRTVGETGETVFYRINRSDW